MCARHRYVGVFRICCNPLNLSSSSLFYLSGDWRIPSVYWLVGVALCIAESMRVMKRSRTVWSKDDYDILSKEGCDATIQKISH